MAIARRATAVATHPTSTELLEPVWSTPPVDGDALVAVVAAVVQATLTPPPGWTLQATQDAGAALRMWLYTKLASGEGPSTQWGLSSPAKAFAYTGAYTGVDFGSIGYASNATLVTTGLTVPDGGWLVTAAAGRHAAVGSPSTWTTSDGSDVELLDFGSAAASGHDIAGCVYDSDRALSAGSHTRTLTSSKTETTAVCVAVALGPPPPPGLPPLPSGSGTRWGIHI